MDAASTSARPLAVGWLKHWPLYVGFAALAVPTLGDLGSQVWTRESGAHGPIILATGAWLVWRETASFQALANRGSSWLAGAGLLLSMLLYIVGRAVDLVTLEAGGAYGAALSMLYAWVGARAILKNWFPLFYLGFAVPPPTWVVDQVTAPLKQFVSFVATSVLRGAGLPIEREGVTIHVAQYQLLVEDACSGMNSLVGLSAISLLYIYLLRGSFVRYSLLLTLFIIPIAIAGNILRVMTLILLTYFFGDQVAQGFLHFTAGIFLFAIDLLLVFAVDQLLWNLAPKSWRGA